MSLLGSPGDLRARCDQYGAAAQLGGPGAAVALHNLCAAALPPPRNSSLSVYHVLCSPCGSVMTVIVMDRNSNVVMLNVLLHQQQYMRGVVAAVYAATAGVS